MWEEGEMHRGPFMDTISRLYFAFFISWENATGKSFFFHIKAPKKKHPPIKKENISSLNSISHFSKIPGILVIRANRAKTREEKL